MKKPKIEDYIDIRVYDIELSAYIDHTEDVNTDLLEALTEILKGEGAYDTDRFEHANNTIENMKSIAKEAIEKSN